MLSNPILLGAIAGFGGALVVDLHAYSGSPDDAPFNWKKAVARWVSGAITGALTSAGIGAVA